MPDARECPRGRRRQEYLGPDISIGTSYQTARARGPLAHEKTINHRLDGPVNLREKGARSFLDLAPGQSVGKRVSTLLLLADDSIWMNIINPLWSVLRAGSSSG